MAKIIFLHPAHWEQSMGGAELQISYLISYFKTQGHEVHFIYEDQGTIILNKDRIFLHPIKKIRIKGFLGKRWSLYFLKIKKLLKKIQPNIIYTRFYSSWSGMAAEYARKNHIIHIWAIANNEDLKKKTVNLLRHPLNLAEKIWVQKAIKYATHILTQNSYQQNLLEEIYNRRGIKINQMTSYVNEELLIKPKDFINIIWIANFKPFKHPEYFIELAKSLNNEEKCKFIMIGRMDDYHLDLIKTTTEINSNFKYFGEIPNYEVNKYLCESHILVSTSDNEGFSNTFVQAWIREVIVLSMKSNPDDIITDNDIGYICPTLKDLKDKIGFLVYNKNLREKMGKKARKYAIQNHTIENNITKISEFLKF